MGEGFNPLLKATNEFYGHDTVAMLRMLDNPSSWWVAQVGGREAVLRKSLGPLPIGGDTDTVCMTSVLPNDPYHNKGWAPTFLQIVDLGDLSRSVVIAPPGQSGQLGSRHCDDMARLRIEDEYHPMLWKREDVERESAGRLIFESPA